MCNCIENEQPDPKSRTNSVDTCIYVYSIENVL